MRIIWIFLGMAVLFLIPFLIWGGDLEWSTEVARETLGQYQGWAWGIGILLLAADVIAPVPGTAVMSALGFLYGTLAGGSIATLGSFLAGSLAYCLCWTLGDRAATFLIGKKDLKKCQRWFAKSGGWLIVASRWLPLFPEIVACMAGLTRMPPLRFFTALACGCIPVGFTYAFIGQSGIDHPLPALLISIFAPPLLWLIARPMINRFENHGH